MVKNSIKVYGRLKREYTKKRTAVDYHISRRPEHEDLVFNLRDEADPFLRKPHKYRDENIFNVYELKYLIIVSILICRFTKIFDQVSNQDEVFNIVAKPIINSVFNGFNGTIFAYGQTGSGKTYSITGDSNDYEDRGILPRSIEQIFEYIKTTSTQYSIYVSYLEIYNEIGYDLLNSKHQPSRLEELPRVALLEDASGEAHLRNLCILPVTNEQEAMRLLFLGDTNRTIAETPMNEYSSRSHCIFTIYITVRSEKSERIRRSKMHLVDLAGSERIHKSKITGVTLTEAKHINLSLHYLEQVIIALSQTNRSHIPFRNSIMTYILRDSLSGNSLTAMLACLALTQKNIHETLSTCKFAQRVACICTEATINEEIDPQKEILFLRREVDELRRQLIHLKGINSCEKLSDRQEESCRKIVRDYIKGSDELPAELSVAQMRHCLKLMRDNLDYRKRNEQTRRSESANSSLASKYNEIVAKKDEEIATLKELLNSTAQTTETNALSTDFTPYENELFSKFKKDNSKDLDQIKAILSKKYELAKNIAATIQRCQDNIINIRRKLACKTNADEINKKLRSYLLSQQNLYRESLRSLEKLKSETDFLNERLKQLESKLLHNFNQEKDVLAKRDLQFSDDLSLISKDFDYIFDACPADYSKVNFDVEPLQKNVTEAYPRITTSTLNASQEGISTNFLNVGKCRFDLQTFNDLDYNDYAAMGDYNLNNHNLHPTHLRPNSSTQQPERLPKVKTNRELLDELLDTECCGDFQYTSKSNNDFTNKTNNWMKDELSNESKNLDMLKKHEDTPEFLDFMKTIPLTGDIEVDEEIFNFYRTKFTKKS